MRILQHECFFGAAHEKHLSRSFSPTAVFANKIQINKIALMFVVTSVMNSERSLISTILKKYSNCFSLPPHHRLKLFCFSTIFCTVSAELWLWNASSEKKKKESRHSI